MKNKFFNLLLFCIAVFLTFAACEIFLRLTQYKIAHYWRPFTHVVDEPTTNRFDSLLGWKPLPGRYTFSPYTPDAKAFTLTIWPNSARATAPSQRHQKRSVVGVGCSLTQGWAIPDEETMFWKLQQRYPDIEFINLGVAGYSTYQSLLSLENHIKESGRPPKVVLYGLIAHHALRNVADVNWQLILSHMAQRGHVAVPYCLQDGGGQLQCFPPESYPGWVGDRTFRVMHLIKSAFLKWQFRYRRSYAKSVMEKLLIRMDTECKSQGIKFYVVLLQLYNEGERAYYERFLSDSQISFINCDDPRSKLPEMTVEGEGHPSGQMNTIWAQCIEEGIKQELN